MYYGVDSTRLKQCSRSSARLSVIRTSCPLESVSKNWDSQNAVHTLTMNYSRCAENGRMWNVRPSLLNPTSMTCCLIMNWLCHGNNVIFSGSVYAWRTAHGVRIKHRHHARFLIQQIRPPHPIAFSCKKQALPQSRSKSCSRTLSLAIGALGTSPSASQASNNLAGGCKFRAADFLHWSALRYQAMSVIM